MFERTLAGLVWGVTEHLGMGAWRGDTGEGGSECGFKYLRWEGSGQPGDTCEVVLSLTCLALRLPEGPGAMEQQVNQPTYMASHQTDKMDHATQGRSWKASGMESQPCSGKSMPVPPVPCHFFSRTAALRGEASSHLPPQKRGLESRRKSWSSGSQPSSGPQPPVSRHRQVLTSRRLTSSPEGLSPRGRPAPT